MPALPLIPRRAHAEDLPGFPPQPRSRTLRQVIRWQSQVRRALGLRRGVKIGDFYYKELTADSLWRALSRKGIGYKDYRATFPDGGKMVIRCTPRRVYADLMGPLLLPRYQRAAHLIRPGMRLLDVSSGTGYGADWLAAMTGPSGGVVALERDAAAVAFAQRRYPRNNAGFEVGGVEDLHGETDGAFDAVFCIALIESVADPAPLLAELWRVVAPRGFLLISAAAATHAAPYAHLPANPLVFEESALRRIIEAACAGALPLIIDRTDDGWIDAIARRPAEGSP